MKQNNRCLRLSFYELQTQWRCFLVFFLISVILLAAMISVFSLTKQIPAEMTDYINSTGEGSISVTLTDFQQLEEVEKLPVNFRQYQIAYMWEDSIGISTQWEPTDMVEGQPVMLSSAGSVVYWVEEDCSDLLTTINAQLLSGRGVTAADNRQNAIWLSRQAADVLGVQCGDTITFTVSSAGAKPVTCEIVGIYHQNIYLYTYYVSLPLYRASLDSVDIMTVTLVPQNLKDYQNILAQLQEMHLAYDFSDEFMNSVMMLIYALYAVCLFLCLLETAMMFSISRSYFHKRRRFFSMCKAIGMRQRDIFGIVYTVMFCFLVIAFVIAMCIAPFLNQYMKDLLEELFGEMLISINVWNPFSAVIFGITALLLLISCIISNAAYAVPDIVTLIRREND